MVKAVFDELGRERPKRHFTVGIFDDVTHLSLDVRPRRPHPAGRRRGAGGVLRARRGRHRRGQQGVGEDHRREHRPVRAGLLRLRLQEVGVGDGVAPALRPRADPLDLPRSRTPTSSPATSSACWSRCPCSTAPSRAPRSCSTARYGPDEVWDRLAPRGAAADHRASRLELLGHRRLPRGPRDGDGQPHQHGHAAVLLPAGRRAAGRRGDRADQGVGREGLRPPRPDDRRAQLRRHRPLAGGARAG